MISLPTRSVAPCCALALAACTSMNVVSDRAATPAQPPVALTKSVQVGDQVRVTTVDGAVHVWRVSSVSETELAGVPEGAATTTTLPADRIARIERRDRALGKTSLLTLGVAGGIAVTVLGLAAVAFVALLAH